MGKCVCSNDVCVDVKGDRVLVATYAFTLEVEVDKVKDVKVVRGNPAWLKEC